MSALDQIVNVNISQSTAALTQVSFAIPAVFGPSNRFVAVTPTGNTVNGSPIISNLSSMTGVSPGCTISGTGIPSGSYITSVAGSSITISANCTATNTGTTLTITDTIRAYSGTAGMLADGFLTTDPEYIRAAEFDEQNVTPPLFYVGKYSASVAQVDTIAVSTKDDTHLYHFLLNGQTISYQAGGTDTQQAILNALLTDIGTVFPTNPPVTGVVSGTGSGALLTLTSATPGVPFTDTTTDADLTITPSVTQNHTITSDIAIAQIENNTWYGLSICSNADQDILQVAAFIESQLKIFIPVSNDAAIATSSTTDLGSTLKGLAYKRTGLIFSIAALAQGIEAGWMGGQLPLVPGSNNWAFVTVAGASPDTLTTTQQQSCIGIPEAGVQGKNVNIYQTVGGSNCMQMGTMAGGQYIDITVGIDWLKTTIQTNLFSAFKNALKIPYTDKGTSILISGVKAAIDQGVINGLIDGNSPITITAPPVLSVPVNQRANRIAPTITFVCRLQGAFNAVIVNGVVTV